MFGDLTNITTETLLDMVCAIVRAERLLTSDEIAELEQIENELQHRGLCLRSELQLSSRKHLGRHRWPLASIHTARLTTPGWL